VIDTIANWILVFCICGLLGFGATYGVWAIVEIVSGALKAGKWVARKVRGNGQC
jgi:hypothetical protein